MASGFFALFDDISTLMDDIAAISKIATKKTVGLLGDDLAVGAKKSSGFVSSRELPVIWAITKGSFVNKLILLPVVFLLSAFLSWAVVPILLLGGLYISFEGVEKMYEYIFRKKHKKHTPSTESADKKSILSNEEKKIKSAVRTDFILSIEIVVVAISTVKNYPIYMQIPVVSFVAFAATIGVYGIVALIVRMDDTGLKLVELSNGENVILEKIGMLLIKAMPLVIKTLSVVGTLAMVLVAGGIYLHNVGFLFTVFHDVLNVLPALFVEFFIGLVLGICAFFLVKIWKLAYS